MPSLELEAIRQRLAGETGQRYWRSLEELAETPEFSEFLAHEFPRLAAVWNAPINRRQALKLMAASMALAGLSACRKPQPPERIVPYVDRPDGAVAGEPVYYATTLSLDGYAQGVLAETREGRPVKIEGNPEHPASLGATDAFAQAAVLSLYDPDRSQAVTQGDAVTGYDQFLAALAEVRTSLSARDGQGLAVLSGPMSSPSRLAALQRLQTALPGMRWFSHEPVSRRNAEAGAELAYGQPLATRYRQERAQVVLSLDADIFATEPGKLRYARDWVGNRKLDGDQPARMSRLYVAENSPSITGASADHRLSLPAGHIYALAVALARAIDPELPRASAEPLAGTGVEAHWVDAVAADLKRHAEQCLIVVGPQQPREVHALAHAMNETLGNTGSTLVHTEPVMSRAAHGLTALSGALARGEVEALLILDANPVYNAPPALAFAERLAEVPFSVHWGDYADETAEACTWHLPATHPLEAWDDARAFDGTVSLSQPTIRPLHEGLTAQQVLAAFAGDFHADAEALVKRHWQARYDGDDFQTYWQRALQRGLIPESALPAQRHWVNQGLWERLPAPRPGDALELALPPDPCVWDGRFANNAWLQELPKPLTKLTWDNAALISPDLAERLGVTTGQMVTLSVAPAEPEANAEPAALAAARPQARLAVSAPVFIHPGQPARSVALALGYGRWRAGRVGHALGVNAFALAPREDAAVVAGLRVTPEAEHMPLATTQHHHSIEGEGILRSGDLETYRADPGFATEDHPQELPSLYPESPSEAEHAWAMAIDLNACIGCNACIAACQAENNIPVVGKEEVARGHDMHWLRVDRYYAGPPEDPSIRFQPVPCMHCENAPCEYVCPVEATLHSQEGLNQMIYNRCIGTRYCAQNCPYKVRRFNWFDYQIGRYATPAPAQNPEVTVRSRGVMEKCTYCVQRIQSATIAASAEDRPIRDAEIKTACQQACPTEAIVFGDRNDTDSEVARLKRQPRNYAMLAELNTRPRTTYLAEVRNPNPDLQAPGSEPGSTADPATEPD